MPTETTWTLPTPDGKTFKLLAKTHAFFQQFF